MKAGDNVVLEYQGERVLAEIDLISGNARSVFLSFEAVLGGHAGAMPLLMDRDGVYRSLITGGEATVTPLS